MAIDFNARLDSKIDNAIQLLLKSATKCNFHITDLDKKVNEEDFELRKKDSIVEIILREDTLGKTINPFVNNILVYNYDKMDTTEDIESLTFEKYKNVIEGLDFSHYAISMMLKNGDKCE